MPLVTLLRTLGDSLRILRELDTFTSGTPRESVDWEVVSASFNSPLTLQVVGRKRMDGPVPGRIIEAYLGGLYDLESGRETSNFSDQALEDATDIVRSSLKDGIASVTYSCPGLPTVTPTIKLVENAEKIIRKRYYYEDGVLEGRLETCSIHGRPHFVIYDVLNGRPTKCMLDDNMLMIATGSLGRRVAVEGIVKFSRAGWPISMEAREMTLLREASELPQFEEGEQIDITGGLELAEYLRRLSDVE